MCPERQGPVQVTDALTRGTDVIFRVDIQGAQTVRRVFPDAVSLFLVCPNAPLVLSTALLYESCMYWEDFRHAAGLAWRRVLKTCPVLEHLPCLEFTPAASADALHVSKLIMSVRSGLYMCAGSRVRGRTCEAPH